MTNEMLLCDVVRDWAASVLPGEPEAADGAAVAALRCYAEDASVDRACRTARSFLESWARHPAHRRGRAHEQVRIAS
jgi:hypothetical protein